MLLCNHDLEDIAKDVLEKALGRRKASASMLLWCQRSEEYMEKWNLISKSDLAFRIQEVLEKNQFFSLLTGEKTVELCVSCHCDPCDCDWGAHE